MEKETVIDNRNEQPGGVPGGSIPAKALRWVKNTALRLAAPYRGPQSEERVDVLDGIRVLFVLLVGWYHIWQQSWLTPHIGEISLDFMVRSGYEWVDAMLLLSGFLLYLPYAGGKKLNVLQFYKKRAARIIPSYFLFILIMLFAVVFPQGGYQSVWEGVRDILAHVTFTHNLFEFSYTGSPINGVVWTLAVEMQFYLLFPLLCLCFKKKPLLTWLCMSAVAFGYRAIIRDLPDTTLYINQLPAFFDVYANGFLAASVYLKMKEKLKEESFGEKVFFTAVFVLCLFCAAMLMREQAAENGYDSIHLGQLDRRFLLSAVLSCLMAIGNGYQSCIMAPTEVLAQQHYNNIQKYLAPTGVRCALLTGSTGTKARREIHQGLEDGSIGLVVGTHALLEEPVQFKALGLAVVDEQHRFGVEQRSRLWAKGPGCPPHILVMTATPIPRTLAMTLYGDLDVSVLDEMPPGRKPVQTLLIGEGKRAAMYNFMRKEIAAGHQVFVVYPMIFESEKTDLQNLERGYEDIIGYYRQYHIKHRNILNRSNLDVYLELPDWSLVMVPAGGKVFLCHDTGFVTSRNTPDLRILKFTTNSKFKGDQKCQKNIFVGKMLTATVRTSSGKK